MQRQPLRTKPLCVLKFYKWKSWRVATDAEAFSEICFRGLVDSAKLLTATKSTGHLVFNPRCLCGDKPFACLYRAEGMILFQPRDIVYRIVQALRKSCINSTSIYPEDAAPSRVFQIMHRNIHREGYHRRTQASLR
jgi:hypothetical protein